jgi:hypothetical protein
MPDNTGTAGRGGKSGDRGDSRLFFEDQRKIEDEVFTKFRRLTMTSQQRLLREFTYIVDGRLADSKQPKSGQTANEPSDRKGKGKEPEEVKKKDKTILIEDELLPMAMYTIVDNMTRTERSERTGQTLLTGISVIRAAWKRCLRNAENITESATEMWRVESETWDIDLVKAESPTNDQIDEIKLSFHDGDELDQAIQRVNKGRTKRGEVPIEFGAKPKASSGNDPGGSGSQIRPKEEMKGAAIAVPDGAPKEAETFVQETEIITSEE